MPFHYKSMHKQSGVALIVVLLLLAIMAMIAAEMSGRLFTQFHRVQNQVNGQQAYWYSVGVEELAKVAIEKAYEDDNTINLSQAWAISATAYPLDYGEAIGSIRDKQACFNINSLRSVSSTPDSSTRPFLVEVWFNLLESVGVERYLAEVVADSTWEFVDENITVDSMSGVEDANYQSYIPAYLAPNTVISDVSELRAVNGVSADIYRLVSPFVCGLPTTDWYLNVNTLFPSQAILLAALFAPNLDVSDAQAVLENRPYDGWSSVDSFLSEPEMSVVDETTKSEAKSYLSVDSQYFELDVHVFVEESRTRVRSLLYSRDKKEVEVIRRKYGGKYERTSDNQTE